MEAPDGDHPNYNPIIKNALPQAFIFFHIKSCGMLNHAMQNIATYGRQSQKLRNNAMALTKCSECGKEISQKAKVCPHCGAPNKKKGLTIPAKIGVAVMVLVVIGYALESGTGTATEPGTAAKKTPAADCSTQADRKAFIDKLISQGYWQKVERPGNLYHVYVLPEFMQSATFDDKQQFVSVVSAFSQCEGSGTLVVVYDAMTNEKIGSYAENGLDMD